MFGRDDTWQVTLRTFEIILAVCLAKLNQTLNSIPNVNVSQKNFFSENHVLYMSVVSLSL